MGFLVARDRAPSRSGAPLLLRTLIQARVEAGRVYGANVGGFSFSKVNAAETLELLAAAATGAARITAHRCRVKSSVDGWTLNFCDGGRSRRRT